MSEVLNVVAREPKGKRFARRMRDQGSIPAIMYGHGSDPVALTVSAKEVAAILRHQSRVVQLKGIVNQQVLIRELQWDSFGVDILHVDFAVLVAGETVEVRVPIELRGAAPGVREGGVVDHVTHDVEVQCAPNDVPTHIDLNINELELGQSLTLADLPLPEGVTLVGEDVGSITVVQCHEPTEIPDEEVGAELSGNEPEVIGRKAEDEEEGS